MAFGKNSRAYNIVVDVSPNDIYPTEDAFQLPSWEDLSSELDFNSILAQPSDIANIAVGILPQIYNDEEDALLRHQLDYTVRDPVDSLAADLRNAQVSGPVRRGSQKSSKTQLRRAAGEPSRRHAPYTKKTQDGAKVKQAKKTNPTTFLDAIDEHIQRTFPDQGLTSEFSRLNIVASRPLGSMPLDPFEDRNDGQTGGPSEMSLQLDDEGTGTSNSIAFGGGRSPLHARMAV